MNKNIKIKKVTAVELIVLLLMLCSFMAALYFTVQENRLYSLVFISLHGVLAIGYFLISQDRVTKQMLDMNEKNVRLLNIEQETELGNVEKLRKENKAFAEKTAQLENSIQRLSDENKLLNIKLEEREKAVSYEKNKEQYNMLLPENENTAERDIISIIRKVYEKFEVQCAEYGIRLNLSTACGRLPMICDERFITVLFSNIVDNSVKYMNRNGSFITTVSDIGEEGTFIVCKDNGEGLPASEVPYIFGLNFQGSNRKSGNGLGLAQVKSVVEHYGGTVYAKSDKGQGMAIYIQFPSSNMR